MRILIIEDQRKMANFIQRGLKEEKYAIDAGYESASEYGVVLKTNMEEIEKIIRVVEDLVRKTCCF